MSPKHLRGLVLVAAWLVPMGAQAEEAGVGDVGVHSVDIPTVELAPLESALDHALGTTAARALTRTATLSALALDPNVAADRAEAKKAADRGLALLRGLDSKKALEQFDKAAALMKASHTDLLDPVDFAKLYTERAKIPLMVPNLAAMREEFAQAVPYHPTKRLDPLSFRPGGPAFPAFEEALQAAKKKPMEPMGRAVLADVCRKTGVHWVVGGEVRANPKGSWSVLLSLGDSGEVVHFRPIEVPPENPGPALEQALLELLKTAKVPLATPEVARVETPPPAPTPTVTAAAPSPSATPLALASASPAPILGPDPHSSAAGPSSVPAQALPGPVVQRSGGGGGFHPRWYVIAGAVAVIGAGAALAAGASSKSGSGQSGITLTITR